MGFTGVQVGEIAELKLLVLEELNAVGFNFLKFFGGLVGHVDTRHQTPEYTLCLA